jgi:soluble lytic murein transglycosylase-like protein
MGSESLPRAKAVCKPTLTKASAKPRYHDLVEALADRYDMDADLIATVSGAESNFDPKAGSRRDARGLMQSLPQNGV